MRKAALSRERTEILSEIASVIRLVKTLREQLQHPVVVRLVAILQRVKEHEATARLEYARELGERLPPHLGRQLVKQEYAGECILARIRQRNGLGFGDQEIEPAPALQMASGLREVAVRHVETDDGEARPGLLDEVDEAPGTTADVKEFELPLVAPGEDLVQWNERLATDRVGGAVEQHFDLGVVALRGVFGEPATRLEMEVLQIVGGPPAADIVGEHLAHLTRL